MVWFPHGYCGAYMIIAWNQQVDSLENFAMSNTDHTSPLKTVKSCGTNVLHVRTLASERGTKTCLFLVMWKSFKSRQTFIHTCRKTFVNIAIRWGLYSYFITDKMLSIFLHTMTMQSTKTAICRIVSSVISPCKLKI